MPSILPVALLVQDSQDEAWEDTLARDELDVEIWLEYAVDKLRRGQEKASVCSVFERALQVLPGSYKLWHAYLRLRSEWLPANNAPQSFVNALVSTFERSLVYMQLYPRIWLMYGDLLRSQSAQIGGQVRRVYDRALRALPQQQHALIWHAYEHWIMAANDHTAIPFVVGKSVLTRLAAFTGNTLALVRYCKVHEKYVLAVDEMMMQSVRGISMSTLKDVLELCLASPEACRHRVGDVYSALQRDDEDDEDQERRMECLGMLGEVLTRLGEFDFAREVYEYALFECSSLQRFTALFDALAKLEEELLLQDDSAYNRKRVRRLLDDRADHVHGRLFLTKWPGDVRARIAYAELYNKKKDPAKQREIILAAPLPTNDVEQPAAAAALYNGTGAELFAYLGDVELGLAKLSSSKRDVVELWRVRIERELLAKSNLTSARQLAKESLVACPRSTELWALFLDLEHAAAAAAEDGVLDTVRAAYESALERRTISVLGVLHYCQLLQKHDYFEDSFNVFERAIGVFSSSSSSWRCVQDLYAAYQKGFLLRYGGAKLERVRDIFEQWLRYLSSSSSGKGDGADDDKASLAFFLYARFEHEFGLHRNEMQVCERWCKFPGLPSRRRVEAYLFWAKQAEDFAGAPGVRPVLEMALKDVELKDADLVLACVHFAHAERRLGELERARAIFKHGAFLQDPAAAASGTVGLTSIWDAWSEFEVAHGNEDTFREMLRVKRTVQVHYSVLHASAPPPPEVGEEEEEAAAGKVAEEEAAGANPEEIDLAL